LCGFAILTAATSPNGIKTYRAYKKVFFSAGHFGSLLNCSW